MVEPNPIRVGIVGLGRAGWGMHCRELADRPDTFGVVAACDLIAQRRAMAAERFGCPTFRKVADLVACPEVELVSIATRTCDHFAHARLALEAGKDVLVEKPMCPTYDEARRLVALARRLGRRLLVKQNRRFEPGFQHVREIMAEGLLGRVHEVQLRRVGFKRRDDWQTFLRFGGGILSNWGAHILDHALLLLDSPVRAVWSDLRRLVSGGDAEDHAHVILTGENGRVVDVEISDAVAAPAPEYVLTGSRGSLTLARNTISLRYLDRRKPLRAVRSRASTPGSPDTGGYATRDSLEWIEREMPMGPKARSGMATIWEHIHDALRRGVPFPVTLEQCLAVLRVISRVRRGTPFEIPPKRGE